MVVIVLLPISTVFISVFGDSIFGLLFDVQELNRIVEMNKIVKIFIKFEIIF